ncbi:MAG: endonuclease MutS2 [Arcobacter sp.]|nr:MAG: endonuclease MutS2 [Arcobacter sp.]
MSIKDDTISTQLDLSPFLDEFSQFFSREKPFFIEGDQNRHFSLIKDLDKHELKSPAKLKSLDTALGYLKKQGLLNLEDIFEFVKIIRYFHYLQNRDFDGLLGSWINGIEIHEDFAQIQNYFDEEGNFNEHLDEDLVKMNQSLKNLKEQLAASMKRILYTQKLESYLVDRQIHYHNGEECLLLRPGFNHHLKGNIVGRSSAGFFYVSPDSISRLKAQVNSVVQEKESVLYEYSKTFSLSMQKMHGFLKFINKSFDLFDHYQARVSFARSKDLHILKAEKSDVIVLNEFKHPAIKNAKSVNVDFSSSVLMVTGVNAGGKTMLLKSILASAYLVKYLIPLPINPEGSRIGTFKNIHAIIDDPQNVKNDISTFAGRMLSFGKLFSQEKMLIGVDEIELGTDSDEAAALFKSMLEALMKKGMKVVVTTHHKRLASLMAENRDVSLMAAVYDEANRRPTYDFLQGIIGKSYAFETAIRYGVPGPLVAEARVIYGKNHEKLNALIERSSELERSLVQKHEKLNKELDEVYEEKKALKEAQEAIYTELKKEKENLSAAYNKAIKEAKIAVNSKDEKELHRALNRANKELPKDKPHMKVKTPYTFKVGDDVQYRRTHGTIISIKKKEAHIEAEGMKLRVKLVELKPVQKGLIKQKKTQLTVEKDKRSGLKLDLHGLRAEEAMEQMDVFLSDALISGWDEVIIYHGIGTGKLAYAVKEFLKIHPSVQSFCDAPAHMGGFGAKIVVL